MQILKKRNSTQSFIDTQNGITNYEGFIQDISDRTTNTLRPTTTISKDDYNFQLISHQVIETEVLFHPEQTKHLNQWYYRMDIPLQIAGLYSIVLKNDGWKLMDYENEKDKNIESFTLNIQLSGREHLIQGRCWLDNGKWYKDNYFDAAWFYAPQNSTIMFHLSLYNNGDVFPLDPIPYEGKDVGNGMLIQITGVY